MSKTIRVLRAATGLALVLGMGLAACSTANLTAALPEPASSSRIFDDLTADHGGGKRPPVGAPKPSSRTARAEIYPGANAEGARNDGGERTDKGATRAAGDGINLNFENAEIKTVARAILGDVLSLNYAVDPRVTGTITLSTRRPVPRADTLPLLETALRGQGAVIVRQNGVYRILPDKSAAGSSGANVGRKAKGEGYAITAMPLENISAEALLKILDGFGTRPRAARVDPEHNLLIVQGTQAERQSVIDTALAFDVDWMRNQSVGVFPLHNASPNAVIREVGRMVDQGSVQFQPIERMNAILVVARSAKTIRRVATWIGRLDRANDAGARVRVYRLKYADARRVANVMKEVFGGGSSQSLDAAAKQVAPGMGTVTARSGAAVPSSFGQDTARANTRQSHAEESTDEPGFAADGAPNGKLRITSDPESNAVVVYASEAQAKQIEQAIQDLDRAPLQVAIEATIAEVSLNDTLRNGVQFFLTSRNLGLRKNTGSVGNLTDGLPLSRVVPGLNFLLGSEASPKLVLDALRDVTEVKILSSPSLVVVNNQPALLQVGDQVPITTRSAQGVESPTAPVVNSIDFRDTGVILKVVPRVHPDSMIGIDIEQEISSVKDAGNAGPDSAATPMPTISQRRVKSKVSVADGQTLLIGGLMSEQRTKGKSGIPGINDIPVIGELFAGMHKVESVQTELIIFIKPRVLRNTTDARRLAEDMRRRMKGFERW
ncbi:MAG TPA: type II secretion system secretin GspD [Hyphomicrobiaceae bacterium]|nr:type II secretion system secretin GspD [Hyphomicrobiaceae bacterium]